MYETPKSKNTLEWWIGMGLVPGIAYVVDMLIINFTHHNLFSPLFVLYAMLMPVFALVWLLWLAREDPIIHFAGGGPSMTRGSYIFRLLAVHIAVWVLLSLMLLTETFGKNYH